MFNLDKDLIFFDLETTGGDVNKDRIIQAALIKYPKDGSAPIERKYMVNPMMPINPEAVKVHGITDEMVKDAPPFKLIAIELLNFIGDADLAGYNSNRFDIPLLIEEFARTGMVFTIDGRRLIDALLIFYKMEPRTLRAAMKFYCGKELTDAHDAMADAKATAEVLAGQIRYYENVDWVDVVTGDVTEKPVRNDMQVIHNFINGNDKRVDLTGRFVRDEKGLIIFNFGNQKGQQAADHPNVLRWIIEKDFPLQVKEIARAILAGKMK